MRVVMRGEARLHSEKHVFIFCVEYELCGVRSMKRELCGMDSMNTET